MVAPRKMQKGKQYSS